MAYYSKYTGAELEERIDKIEEIPQLIAQMITGKDFVTKEDLLCVLRDYAPATYATIPIDNNTIYWENGVLKAATSDGGGQCQWELREHNGVQYLFSRLPVVTQYDVTMYADVNRLDLPNIYDGLPIDGDTIYWEETEEGRVLKAKFNEDVGVDASEVLNIISNAGYATQTWVNNQNFVNKSFLNSELSKFVTLGNEYQEIEGVKNFLNGIQLGGISIYRHPKHENVLYIDGDVVVSGAITMFAEGNDIDSTSIAEGLPFDQRTIWYNPETKQIEVIGGTGGSGEGVSNFWDLSNIPSWITQVKPIYQYSEIINTPDLSVYTTTSLFNKTLESYVTRNTLESTLNNYTTLSHLSNTLLNYTTLTELTNRLKEYVALKGEQNVEGVKNFINGIKIGDKALFKLKDDIIYLDANLVVRGGVTMFYENGEIDLPTIKDEIGIAGYDGAIGLASFNSSQFSINSDGTVTIIGGSTGLDTNQLAEYLTNNKYATQSWVTSQGYASSSSLSALQNEVHDFLEGSDADNIINKWRELESFLSGLRESDNLSDILATKANQSALDATNATVATKWTQDNNKITQWNTAYGWGDHSKAGYALNSALQALSNVVDTKWTQDNAKISNWDTAYGWGNHASVGYALKSYVDNTFVTIGGNEDVTGVHNFVNGLKIGNVKVSKIQDGAIYVEGDLVVKGGVTMYSDSNADFDSIYDGLPIDGTTIYWDNGVLKAKHTEGALTDITSEMVIAALGYVPYNASNPSGYITISALDGYVNEISTSGSGNAVTSVSKNGKKITFTKGATFLTEHQDLSGYQTKITSSNKLAYSLISGTPTSLPASDVYSWAKASVKPSYVWGEIGEKPNFASVATSGKYSDLSGTPTSLKNPTSLKFGSKTYDGSSEQTILASDLGALTSHQSIYTLTFQSGSFSAGSFTANSGNKTINIPTTTEHISEGSNLYFTNARAVSALKSITDGLASDIATKWTQNDSKISNWDTAYSWGDHSKNDYTTNKYVNDTFVTIGGNTEQTITGAKNFTGGLKVNGNPIIYDATNKYWKLEGDLLVTGGVTMYGVDEGDLPSILDSLPIASTTALGIAKYDSNYFSVNSDGLVTLINAPSSGATSGLLGSFLLNVDDSVDTTPSVDRVLYQPAGSSMWTWKALSEIGGGSSGGGGSVSGNYLPLSGGTITSDGVGLLIKRSNTSPSIGFIGKNDNGTYYYYGYFKYKGQNNPYIEYANGTDYPILHAGNYSDYALPLSGGTLKGNSINVLTINTTNTTQNTLALLLNGVNKGALIANKNSNICIYSYTSDTYMGMLDNGTPYWRTGSTEYPILHGNNYSSYALPLSGGTLSGAILFSDVAGQSLSQSKGDNIVFALGSGSGYTTKGTEYGILRLFHNGTEHVRLYANTESPSWINTYRLGIGTTIPACSLDVVGEQHCINMRSSSSSSCVLTASILDVYKSQFGYWSTGTVMYDYTSEGYIKICNSTDSGTKMIEFPSNTFLGTNYATRMIVMNPEYLILGYDNVTRTKPTYIDGHEVRIRYGDNWANLAHFKRGGDFHVSGIVSFGYYGQHNDSSSYTGYIGRGSTDGRIILYSKDKVYLYANGVLNTTLTNSNLLCSGGITQYSDIRKKTKLADVELSLSQIANAPLIQHYYNSDQDKTTHVGSIAQYWYGMNDWFCKEDSDGYLTMEIQNCALASAISIARELDRYETKTDKTIRKMKQRIAELEDEVERLKNN